MSALYQASHERAPADPGARRPPWFGAALALAIAAAAIVAAITLPPPSFVDEAVANPALPPVGAFVTAEEPAGVSTASVDWSRVEAAPDPSPMAVAAYGP